MEESFGVERCATRRASRAIRAALAAAVLLTAMGVAALPAAASTPASPKAEGSGLSGVVNLNTASSEELQILPGIGASRAGEIVAMRKQRGGFKQVDELLEVKGIGETMLERLRPHVTLKGKTTARRL